MDEQFLTETTATIPTPERTFRTAYMYHHSPLRRTQWRGSHRERYGVHKGAENLGCQQPEDGHAALLCCCTPSSRHGESLLALTIDEEDET